MASIACGDDDACPAGTQRIGDQCRRPGDGPAPAYCTPGVLINEVLPDPEGRDGEGLAFVEISGPAGTSLDDWELESVNSSGERAGTPILLQGAIASDGFFLIGESETVQGFGEVDLIDPRVDGTNSKFAFRLLCGGVTMDALAYGVWEEESPGEGYPAAKPGSGQSLARCPSGQDQDDNAADFALAEAVTPGAPNTACPPPPPSCSPESGVPAAGELLVNEINPGPIDLEDGQEIAEFIEIVNIGVRDLDLSQHVVRWNPNDEGAFNKEMVLPPGTCVPLDGGLLIWGGEQAPIVDDVRVILRSSLQVRNSDSIIEVLAADAATLLADACYGNACPRSKTGTSLTRDPDLDPSAPLGPHRSASLTLGSLATPGTCQNGDAFATGCTRQPPGSVCEELVPEGVLINEIGFDPTEDLDGDGEVDPRKDEYIELLNTTLGTLDLSGWTLSDTNSVRAELPQGSAISAGSALLLLSVSEDACPPASSLASEHRCVGSLGLNNSGDAVVLSDGDGLTVDSVTYGAADLPCRAETLADASFTRYPDGGNRLVPHTQANAALTQSPGRRVDGSLF